MNEKVYAVGGKSILQMFESSDFRDMFMNTVFILFPGFDGSSGFELIEASFEYK